MPVILTGIAASPGIAIAPLFAMKGRTPAAAPPVCAESHDREIERWVSASAEAKLELIALRDGTRRELGPEKSDIFDAHLSILSDPELAAAVEKGILESGLCAANALGKAAGSFIELLAATGDDLFTARIDDIRDVVGRVTRLLDGNSGDPWDGLAAEALVAADDLSPSETRLMNPALVKGFATASGSAASHSSILARSMGIPAVVGLGDELSRLVAGTIAIIDGGQGIVIVDPDEAQLVAYRASRDDREVARKRDLEFASRPSLGRDGVEFELSANVGGIEDVASALERGADGIGLFRTEFLFMGRPTLPSEEEQYRVYRHALEMMAPRPVLIRTLDIGGDKGAGCLDLPKEDNPFLGVRALRLCLERPDVFRPQLRALLRASAHGRLRVMFPMVAIAEELRRAKALMEEERARLRSEGIDVAERIETGIMIEIPAAALMADSLAREVDFFSVGSNDLCQYAMAADRMNSKVGYLLDCLHPAVLRLIGPVAAAARREGIWAGVCGEMAADPLALPLLAGAGFRELSMAPIAIPGQRSVLSAIVMDESRQLFETAKSLGSAGEVRDLVNGFLGKS